MKSHEIALISNSLTLKYMVKHVQNPHSMIFENPKKKLKTPIGNLFFIFFIFEKKIPTWISDFGKKKGVAFIPPPPSVADEIETSENLKFFFTFPKNTMSGPTYFWEKNFLEWISYWKRTSFFEKNLCFSLKNEGKHHIKSTLKPGEK